MQAERPPLPIKPSPGSWPVLGPARYRELVSKSWQRCVDEYHLDPTHSQGPPMVGHQELQMRIQRHRDVLGCVQTEMDALYQHLGDKRCAVVLTDTDGVILHMVTSPEFASVGRPLGLRAGGTWSERAAGTNGMGTCLASAGPVLVHREDHFFSHLAQFSCSAVPIFDPVGTMVAVLDVTSASSTLQPSLLTLLDGTARTAESRLLDLRYSDAHMVRFHACPEYLFTQRECRLAVNDNGLILAANRHALLQLGFGSVDALRMLHFEELFQTTLDDMLRRSADANFHPVCVYRTKADLRLFALAQRPADDVRLGKLWVSAPPPQAAASSQKGLIAPSQMGAAKREDLSTGVTPESAMKFGDSRLTAHLNTACRVIARQTPVLLCGETGSGKEVFARAVHQRSPFAQGAFIAINCASLPATLIEAELFGYRAGAFTGAERRGREGKILQAHKGTLFLDEIADMPLELQARLLRVLDERRVSPLGTEESHAVDFQLISASHQYLPDLVRQHRFREDLFYRLAGIELRLPALRERQDRRELIYSILQAEDVGVEQLSASVEQQLMNYAWPGNLRELRHVLRTMAALADGGTLLPDHMPHLQERALHRASQPGEAPWDNPTSREVLAQYRRDSAATGPQGPVSTAALDHYGLGDFDAAQPMGCASYASPRTFDDATACADQLNEVQRHERQALLQLIERHHWTLSRVAQALGVSRNTLYRKLHKLHIDIEAERGR